VGVRGLEKGEHAALRLNDCQLLATVTTGEEVTQVLAARSAA